MQKTRNKKAIRHIENNSKMTKVSLSLSVVLLVVCKWLSTPIKRQGLAEWIFLNTSTILPSTNIRFISKDTNKLKGWKSLFHASKEFRGGYINIR